jgi:hypothetical protein
VAFRCGRRREEGGYKDFSLFLIRLISLAISNQLWDVYWSSRGLYVARRLPDVVWVVKELLPVLFLLLIDLVKVLSPGKVSYLACFSGIVALPTERSNPIALHSVVLPE